MPPFISLRLLTNRIPRHALITTCRSPPTSSPYLTSRLATTTTRSASSSSHDGGDNEKTALVLGCSGALGNAVSRYLGQEMGMRVLGADVTTEISKSSSNNNSSSGDWDLDGFITVPSYTDRPSIAKVTEDLAAGVHGLLGEEEELDVIVVASGGWAGDTAPVTDSSSAMTMEDIQQDAQEYGENMEKMMYMNLIPVIAAGYTAQRFAGPNGLLVVIGATAALSSTPGMMGYGIAKTGAHHLVRTMGATTGNALDTKMKRKIGRRFRRHAENLDTLSVVGILPTTIDTPSNRQFNPDSDYTTWTKPNDIATEIGTWIDMPPLRPHSGALVKITSEESGSTFEIVR